MAAGALARPHQPLLPARLRACLLEGQPPSTHPLLPCPSRRRPRPAALSWLRRRGPPLPESALHKMFRQETVRMFDPAALKVGRVSKSRVLPPGAMLLLPKAAVADARTAQQAAKGGGSSKNATESRPAQQQRAAAAAALRDSLLHVDRDWLAVSKPAGLATQGGRGVAVSVDDLMGEAFGGLPGVDPAGLRLVHRLDRHTTGAGAAGVGCAVLRCAVLCWPYNGGCHCWCAFAC